MHSAVQSQPQPISKETVGMALFLIAETMFFAALVAAYIVLRLASPTWRPEVLAEMISPLVLGNSAVLFVSSATMFLSQRSVRRDNPSAAKLWMALTLALGLMFVGGQALEFSRLLKLVPFTGNNFGSVFYTLAGLHGLHVAGGVVFLTAIFVRLLRGRYHAYQRLGVRMAAAYWHYVALVWVFLFLALYVW